MSRLVSVACAPSRQGRRVMCATILRYGQKCDLEKEICVQWVRGVDKVDLWVDLGVVIKAFK